jgi:hypothetical protein
MKPAVDKPECAGTNHFAANSYTTGTKDAFIVVNFNIRMAEIDLVLSEFTFK